MSAAIRALLEIMTQSSSLRNRLRAAEDLLERESPADVREQAQAFLTSVHDDREILDSIRREAASIVRRAEARKVTQPPAIVRTGERGLAYKIAQARARYTLQKELEAKGLWPAPPGWDDHIMSPDWPGPTDEEPPNPIGLADRLGAARQAYLEKQQEKKAEAPKAPKDE